MIGGGKDCEEPTQMTEGDSEIQGSIWSPDWPVGTNLRKLYAESQISETKGFGSKAILPNKTPCYPGFPLGTFLEQVKANCNAENCQVP